MSNPYIVVMLIAITSILLISALYYVNKYRRMAYNAIVVCRELILIRKQLYNENNEEANDFVNKTFNNIKAKIEA